MKVDQQIGSESTELTILVYNNINEVVKIITEEGSLEVLSFECETVGLLDENEKMWKIVTKRLQCTVSESKKKS